MGTNLCKPSFFSGLFSYVTHKVHHAYRSSALFHSLGRLLADSKCPKGLPSLAPVEKVNSKVWRILGLNPGSHTLQGTNTWLVGTTDTKVLIDSGEDVTATKYVTMLLDTVFPITNTKAISMILLTHGHGDHQGGVETLIKELKKRGLPSPRVYKRHIAGGGDFPAGNFPCEDISNGQEFEVETGILLKALYSPGHTDDHVCFVLDEENYWKENKALFSGDCVLGCGTTVFDDLYTYMNSLQSLRQLMLPKKSGDDNTVIDTIYPGHGPVIAGNALAKVDEYISHRLKRENEIYAVLQQAHSYQSSWDIMTAVYGSQLPLFIKISAQWNCHHHLKKLQKEGKLDHMWPDLWRVVPSSVPSTQRTETDHEK